MSFVKNDNQQLTVLDSTFNLTEREKRMLEKSWANTFADKVFPAIDENIFSVLYSKKASRPNTPVNVIVGLQGRDGKVCHQLRACARRKGGRRVEREARPRSVRAGRCR